MSGIVKGKYHFTIGMWIAVGCTIVIALIVALLLFWSFEPGDKLEIDTNGRLYGATEHNEDGLHVVELGESIYLYVRYCNNGVDVISERFLESPSFSVFESSDGETPVAATALPRQDFFPQEAQCGYSRVQFSIPEYIIPGVYRLKNVNFYSLNPLRQKESVTYYSEFFEVVEAGE